MITLIITANSIHRRAVRDAQIPESARVTRYPRGKTGRNGGLDRLIDGWVD